MLWILNLSLLERFHPRDRNCHQINLKSFHFPFRLKSSSEQEDVKEGDTLENVLDSDKPGFKLLTSEDLARENGGDVNAYDDYDDVVVIGSSI